MGLFRTPEELSFTYASYDKPKYAEDPDLQQKLVRQRNLKQFALARRQKIDGGKQNIRQIRRGADHQSFEIYIGRSSTPSTPSSVSSLTSGSSAATPSSVSSPSFDSDDDEESIAEEESFNSQMGPLDGFSKHRYKSSMLMRFYPSLVLPEDFFLLQQVMPLTGIRLGVASLSVFDPTGHLDSTPHLGSRRLLTFIPSRYSEVTCLRHATDCVVAKLRFMLLLPERRTSNQETAVLLHYARALKALQAALDDDRLRKTPETLCATVLLGVYEMLNGNPGTESWVRHASGAARLIQIHGAKKFESDFERALFMAHVGPTVMEAFLGNKPCFLDDEHWQKVMYSAIFSDDALDGQRDLVVGLWSQLVRGPKVFKEVTDAIMSDTPVPQEVIEDLIERLLKDRAILQWWLLNAQTCSGEAESEQDDSNPIIPLPRAEGSDVDASHVTQLALRGTYTMCSLLKGRLLYALAPARFQELEMECQERARAIMDSKQDNPSMTGTTGTRLADNFFMSQSIWLAKGVLETRDSWSDCDTSNNGTIDKWKFASWCKAIGRKV